MQIQTGFWFGHLVKSGVIHTVDILKAVIIHTFISLHGFKNSTQGSEENVYSFTSNHLQPQWSCQQAPKPLMSILSEVIYWKNIFYSQIIRGGEGFMFESYAKWKFYTSLENRSYCMNYTSELVLIYVKKQECKRHKIILLDK